MRAVPKSKGAGANENTLVQHGYAQVEANRLTGITFGNIEAQAPAYTKTKESADQFIPVPVLENGMFLCIISDPGQDDIDVELGRIAVTPDQADAKATPYLVYSEKKIYDERLGYADFADRAIDKANGVCYPRLIGLTPESCVFTTNAVKGLTYDEKTDTVSGVTVGEYLNIDGDGFLTTDDGYNKVYRFVVDKITVMPDNQPAVKVRCTTYPAE